MEMENIDVHPQFPRVYLRPEKANPEEAIAKLMHYAYSVEKDVRENYDGFSPLDIKAFRNAKTGETILKVLIACNGPTVEFIVTVLDGNNTEIDGDLWDYPEIVRAGFDGEMPTFAMWCEEYAENIE